MRSAIDAAGRIVIPKELRDRLGLRRGRPVDIYERDGRIEIEPAAPMRLVRRGRGLVAVRDEKVPPLTDEMVRGTLERTRRGSPSTPAWWSRPSRPDTSVIRPPRPPSPVNLASPPTC